MWPGDEGAALGGAGERIRAHAVPALVVAGAVVLPELLVLDGAFLVEQQRAGLEPLVVVHGSTISGVTIARRRGHGEAPGALAPGASSCRVPAQGVGAGGWGGY